MTAFNIGETVRFTAKETDRLTMSDAWLRRADNEHLGIVIETGISEGRYVRVWDTVERDWWMAFPERLVRAEP